MHIENLWVAGQVIDGIIQLWPVTVLLLLVVLAAIKTPLHHRPERRREMRCACVPFVFPVLITLSGVVLNNPDGRDLRSLAIGPAMICVLLIAQIVISVFLVYRMSIVRLLTIAISCLALWFSLWAGFVGLMSVTGDWL